MTRYSHAMSRRRLTVLQMSVGQRLALAAIGCVIVWVAVAIALA